jgi:hypothetical protein
MEPKETAPAREPRPGAAGTPQERTEQLPTWRNTRPRGNQEPDRQDLKRSEERLEALLGR